MSLDVTCENVDKTLQRLQDGAVKCSKSANSTVKLNAAEIDLLAYAGEARDLLLRAVQGDKGSLAQVFGGNRERILRLEELFNGLKFVHQKDDRWSNLKKVVEAIEHVLKELGLDKGWQPPNVQPLDETRCRAAILCQRGQVEEPQVAEFEEVEFVEATHATLQEAGSVQTSREVPPGPTELVDAAKEAPMGSSLDAQAPHPDLHSGAHNLFVRICAAEHLHDAEYRLFDLSRGCLHHVSGAPGDSSNPRLCAVYCKLRLGGTIRRTDKYPADRHTRAVSFNDERFIFTYDGKSQLHIEVKDYRQVGGALRGNPIVGIADLSLASDLRSHPLREHEEKVPIMRDSRVVGYVSLRYGLLRSSRVEFG